MKSSLVVLHVGYVTGDVASGVSSVVPQYLMHQSVSDEITCALLNICTAEPFDRREETFPMFCGNRLDELPQPFSNPDIVIFHEVYRFQYYPISKQVERKGIPYIVLPHGSLTEEAQHIKGFAKKALNALFFDRFVRRASCVHFLSEREASSSRGRYDKCFVLGNGVEEAREIECEKKNQILFLGRLDVWVKGLDVLIDAVKEAERELRSRGYRVVVAGPSENGSLDDLKKRASSYGIDDIVSFPGLVCGEEKRLLLSESKVYIQLSRTEALPTSDLEAMMYGLPVIVTEGTSMKDVVEKHHLGYGVESNSENVAKIISNVISNGERAAAMGLRARAYVQEKYSWPSVVDEQIACYRSIISGIGS